MSDSSSKAPTDQINLLIIEDDPSFAELVAHELELALPRPVTLAHGTTLAQGLEAIDPDRTEVILLDLNLPDSAGLDSLEAVLERAPQIPVIVLTGLSGGELPLKALRMGAQDFLPKAETDGAGVARALSYAIERSTKVSSLAENVQRLERLLAAPVSAESADRPLAEREPDQYERLTAEYVRILDLASAPGARSRADLISGELGSLAGALGGLMAAPRDLIDIHVAAVNRRWSERIELSSRVSRAGQQLLLELLAETLAYYRDALGGALPEQG